MRRRKLLGALAVLMVALVAAAFALWPRTRITRENFDRVEVGMTRRQVVAILGAPGDYSTGPVISVWTIDHPPVQGAYEFTFGRMVPGDAVWGSDRFGVRVNFDDSGRACSKFLWQLRRTEQGRFENLAWRAKRLWQSWFP